MFASECRITDGNSQCFFIFISHSAKETCIAHCFPLQNQFFQVQPKKVPPSKGSASGVRSQSCPYSPQGTGFSSCLTQAWPMETQALGCGVSSSPQGKCWLQDTLDLCFLVICNLWSFPSFTARSALL